MEKILVTGAGGFIGSHLVQYLVQRGFAVRATDQLGANFQLAREVGAEIVPTDLLDLEGLKKAVCGVSRIVHTAAVFDLGAPRALLERVNVTGVEHMCQVCLSEDIKRFVHFSTVAVYGRPKRLPCREDDPKRPKEDYGRTKWEGEKRAFMYHEKYGLPVTAVRPALVYGPRSRYGHALFIAGAALLRWRGRVGLRSVAGGPLTHHVHVIDVCQAVATVLMEDLAIGKAFNVADNRPVTVEEMMRAIIEPLGMSIQKRVTYYPWLWKCLVYIMLWVLPQGLKRLNRRIARRWQLLTEAYNLVPALRPKVDKPWLSFVLRDQYYDTSRIRGLGWQPRYPDFPVGIQETIEWYRSQRWIP